MDDLLSEFLAECREGMAAVEAELLILERCPDDRARIAAIFRAVHTIKGTCGFLPLPRLGRVAHAAESVLGRLRAGELAAGAPGVVAALFAAVDRIRRIVDELARRHAEPEGEDDDVIALLAAAERGGRPGPPARAAGVATPVGVGAEAAAARDLRVRIDLLERLAGLVGELALTRDRLLRASGSGDVDGLRASLRHLDRITTELQGNAVRTRMRPIGEVWGKLPRMARDLGVELGKTIDLRLEGGETELDRQVLELVRDSLVHMVRNAADHGLETAEERRSLGKPETGVIRLEAFRDGVHVVIRVSDDGRGLDAGRIGARAVAGELVTERELAGMTVDQIRQLVFTPGFSTAERISSVSGRGVGMDVVRTNIERIGGSIEVASGPGQGSTFTIRIPLAPTTVSVSAAGPGDDPSAFPDPAARNSYGPPGATIAAPRRSTEGLMPPIP